MKIHDASRTLSEDIYVYPGDPEFRKTRHRSGEAYTASLSLGTHTGTHMDAPSHYFAGAENIAGIPPERLVQSAEVLPFGGRISGTAKAVLFRSGFSGGEYPQLSAAEAEDLAGSGISVVGCDTPSVGDDAVHRILLGSGVLIIEMLDLASIPDGVYRMIALPLKIADADAAPARVILCGAG
jgi:arylformamidase